MSNKGNIWRYCGEIVQKHVYPAMYSIKFERSDENLQQFSQFLLWKVQSEPKPLRWPDYLSLLHASDVSASAIAIATLKNLVWSEKNVIASASVKKGKFVFLVLVLRLRLRLCQKSSSVKRQNVSAIVSAIYEPPCLCRLCSSVKRLRLRLRLCLRRWCEAGFTLVSWIVFMLNA